MWEPLQRRWELAAPWLSPLKRLPHKVAYPPLSSVDPVSNPRASIAHCFR